MSHFPYALKEITKHRRKETNKSAIVSILRAWLDQRVEDFREPPHFPCLQKLLDYLKRMMPGSDPERRAQNLLEQFQKQEVETDSGLPNTISFSLEEEEELEGRVSAEFTCFSEDLVAEELTYMDAQLFKKVVPHHCLGCIWSRRDKKENKHLAPTIRATISQFNTLTKCVVSTILGGKELKTQQRARIIEKWIDIAHELIGTLRTAELGFLFSALGSYLPDKSVTGCKWQWNSFGHLPLQLRPVASEHQELPLIDKEAFNTGRTVRSQGASAFPWRVPAEPTS
ncbi:ral guanine nucleotide dissociation stimulator-like 1 isoform X2 [Cynocephalus volans]|uniref:ral guanine nucleotide dissociation stimulator-like 1 isoform X2 n=1 Tax=Cynocephalus volans TaxID=110931 RepID=UPI002FCABE38